MSRNYWSYRFKKKLLKFLQGVYALCLTINIFPDEVGKIAIVGNVSVSKKVMSLVTILFLEFVMIHWIRWVQWNSFRKKYNCFAITFSQGIHLLFSAGAVRGDVWDSWLFYQTQHKYVLDSILDFSWRCKCFSFILFVLVDRLMLFRWSISDTRTCALWILLYSTALLEVHV